MIKGGKFTRPVFLHEEGGGEWLMERECYAGRSRNEIPGEGEEGGQASMSETSKKQARVLVVEDEPEERRLVEAMLQEVG